MKCSAKIWREWQGWLPCPYRPKVVRWEVPYCGIHDPVAKAERAEKRGPTRSERELSQAEEAALQRDRIRIRLAAADDLREVGQRMSNACFNLSQTPGYTLTERDCAMMDADRKAWDAALTKYQAAKP